MAPVVVEERTAEMLEIAQHYKIPDLQAAHQLSNVELQKRLLSTWRLLRIDQLRVSQVVDGAIIQDLFSHGDRAVRYLAVRVFGLLYPIADAKLHILLDHHAGMGEPVMGDDDGEELDYRFLSLAETMSRKGLCEEGSTLSVPQTHATPIEGLLKSPYETTLVKIPSTVNTQEALLAALRGDSPVLVHGLAGSGKTALVMDLARAMSQETRLVTLHLNEQTDAKMLVGMYTSGAVPGSFEWRAGVLTTAVKEGRWILIEDLDRAPNEVISVLLPLIEQGELLIPSRGETIRANLNFKIFATIRTSMDIHGAESTPSTHMLGARLWKRVHAQMPSQQEMQAIVENRFPILTGLLPDIMATYQQARTLSSRNRSGATARSTASKTVDARDLLKWCRRLHTVMENHGAKTGLEPLSDDLIYEVFVEAVHCFASSLTHDNRGSMVACVAESLRIDPQRAQHYLAAYVPRLEETDGTFLVGRSRLRKNTTRKPMATRTSKPFANTVHAKRLLEQVAGAVNMAEPVLLVGETGIGKTAVVQQLADRLRHKVTAVNLSQQSEVGDLLGGFKPVNVRSLAIPLKEEFEDLFAATGISASRNQRYLEQIARYTQKAQWNKAAKLWREAPKMFRAILDELAKKETTDMHVKTEMSTKRRKLGSRYQALLQLEARWNRFAQNLQQFEVQMAGGTKSFAFTFVEGNIIQAVRNGHWVLLDEINLASSDTLESIAGLLKDGQDDRPSILLSETGKVENIQAHPDFRIFAAMNPATDVGKRDLPAGLRSRFTEIYVGSPDQDLQDLQTLIQAYLTGICRNDEKAVNDVARLYMKTKTLATEKRLVDGASQVPHYSIRTLTRILTYAVDIAPSYGLRRALYEGFCLGFLTVLDKESENILLPLISHYLLDSHGNSRALLSQIPRQPEDGRSYVRFTSNDRERHYWMLQGPVPPRQSPHYIITPFVQRNMLNLVRATSTRRFPVLIQGPTSSGKTSMIEYLANFSGNTFVRINNHEHTDLQEYLGTYVSDAEGKLHFQEGILVQALRQGHWLVLDELNLAPTDVLEALNRLLDDNRELLIPETQEVVRPHENFMLLATQNPAGLYGGRKILSRAFRNRFLELHFDDIPEDELDFILEKRSQKVAPSDCRRIVAVYKELSRLRQTSRLFEQKQSFATLRDLFRWSLRDAETREQLAANGYMLLAERVRNPEERKAVQDVIERVFKVKVDTELLYASSPAPSGHDASSKDQQVVWTRGMRRLYTLVTHALKHNEPVLLIGVTGCGKTTVCQMLAQAAGKDLRIVNAHQTTETGDIIGSQRPVRNRAHARTMLQQDLVTAMGILGLTSDANDDLEQMLSEYASLPDVQKANLPAEIRDRISTLQVKSKALFEWADGSLVQAMRDGDFFLLDEISLADDSVLERLNSVLEPHRTILLAEKGIQDSYVQASAGFQFLATMNPGGDYGKRELSPALRNRFTEIWVPNLSAEEDILQIVEASLVVPLKRYAPCMVAFASWYISTSGSQSPAISIRDVQAWVRFANTYDTEHPYRAILHGAAMVFIDTVGANPSALLATAHHNIEQRREHCLQKLSELLEHDVTSIYHEEAALSYSESGLSIGDFKLPTNPQASRTIVTDFALDAPTTKINATRILRAMRLPKPILLEGSPGVGKTTLITALANVAGFPLLRINLSEQTDLMDLFGSDVPVEGASAGVFEWRDAPFLQAMQNGAWVLLDEMNLASQSVLEGLNACLDHRGQVYVAELDRTFSRHPNFRVFAAQNPHHQGGGRKGLPSSFVNRFTVVYADVLSTKDLEIICMRAVPDMDPAIVSAIVRFVPALEHATSVKRDFGTLGGPWEFNLRDALRWLKFLSARTPFSAGCKPSDYLDLVVRQRFRLPKDRDEVDRLFREYFGEQPQRHHLFLNTATSFIQVGQAISQRDESMQMTPSPLHPRITHLAEAESIMCCIRENIPCILVGLSGSGKSTLLQHVSAVLGKRLLTFPLNSEIDTSDLVGGFEQSDPQRSARSLCAQLLHAIQSCLVFALPASIPKLALTLVAMLRNIPPVLTGTYFATLCTYLRSMQDFLPNDQASGWISACESMAQRHLSIGDARFQWIDGPIVEALQQGDWLVLDNANLCSSSVLDRLNSVLEPNGVLSIDEHCGPGGEPRIIKPHPDFRVFLTMDPKFGELSRAMRNRAIEIHVSLQPGEVGMAASHISSVDITMQKYALLCNVLASCDMGTEETLLCARTALDHLSWADIKMLSGTPTLLQRLDLTTEVVQRIEGLREDYAVLCLSDEHLMYRQYIGSLLSKVRLATDLPKGFEDAQTIHPLQNSPVVTLLARHAAHDQLPWLAVIYETLLDLEEAKRAFRAQHDSSVDLKASHMNRLQRSIKAARLQDAGKDSTSRVAQFLVDVLEIVKAYLHSQLEVPHAWQSCKIVIRSMMQYWWQTFHLVTAPSFDEVVFRAHLDLPKAMLETARHKILEDDRLCIQLLYNFEHSLQSRFDASWRLTTGLSLKVLWPKLRPPTVASHLQLEQLAQLRDFAMRFDAVRWQTGLPVAEVGRIMLALTSAYTLIWMGRGDGISLLTQLTPELVTLESEVRPEASSVKPFFAAQFEILVQEHILDSMRGKFHEANSVHDTLVVLADRDSESCLSARILNPLFGRHLERLLGGREQRLHLHVNSSHSLLKQLHQTGTVRLECLELLETELSMLATASTRTAACDQQDVLIDYLDSLIMGIVAMLDRSQAFTEHRDSALINLQMRQDPSATSFDSLASVYRIAAQDPFRQLAVASVAATVSRDQKSSALAAFAWAAFATAAIRLFVPDVAYDPDVQQRLEHDQHNQAITKMQNTLAAFRRVEKIFTGQSTNLRGQILEEDLARLGPIVATTEQVFRPTVPEINGLAMEFKNLIAVTLQDNACEKIGTFMSLKGASGTEDLSLLKQNLTHIMHRLQSQYQAYKDLTEPVLSMIRCLLVAVQLAESTAAVGTASKDIHLSRLMQITPFMGAHAGTMSHTSMDNHSLELISWLSVIVAVKDRSLTRPELLDAGSACFHAQYEAWAKQLESDRAEAQQATGLYRFRGTAEDEDTQDQQDFDELFPTFDTERLEDKDNKSSGSDVKQNAAKLARYHALIFTSPTQPVDGIFAHMDLVSSTISASSTTIDSADSIQSSRDLLPAAMLAIDKHVSQLEGSNTSAQTYNFYTDAHFVETRKLVTTMHAVQGKYRQLQAIDEIGHMQPLADVLTACHEVLQFKYTEPLAKIITKVEKVHQYMHEWQFGGWASKAYTSAPLYDQVTNTIVSWRRLELSTWARLLDVESKKCEEDAAAWWFIAYQAIIAIPLSLEATATDEIADYTTKLIQDLQNFLSTAILGQFARRYAIIEQLARQLALLVKNGHPALDKLSHGVANFVAYFAHYRKPVADRLEKDRASLTKPMQDVLLLASWKETNIDALRESAKRSHHKLFKTIRKYRAMLSQEAGVILTQGLPVGTDPLTVLPQASGDDSMNLLATDKNLRQQNATTEGAAYLAAFIANLVSSSQELQKATPSIFDDSTKTAIQHLKTRKRRLYADVLKELREWGIKYNLGDEALSRQADLSSILALAAEMPQASVLSVRAIEHAVHSVVDSVIQVREAARHPSEDLTKAEVARSMGYIEGSLHVILATRNKLVSAIERSDRLDGLITIIEAICTLGEDDKIVHRYGKLGLGNAAWLPHILAVAEQLLEKHAKLNKNDASEVRLMLCACRRDLQNLFEKVACLPEKLLDLGLTTTNRQDSIRKIDDVIQDLSARIKNVSIQRPELAYILDQVLLWAVPLQDHPLDPVSASAIKDLENVVEGISHKVAAAVQTLKSISQDPKSVSGTANWLVELLDSNTTVLSHPELGSLPASLGEIVVTFAQLDLGDPHTGKMGISQLAAMLPALERYQSLARHTLIGSLDLLHSHSRATYTLCKMFSQLARQGFCGPSEKSNDQDGQTEKLESGTGLGDGNGAEDISKDIGDDEDLEELAQERDEREENELEDEKDAVDMADAEMEGQMGDAEEDAGSKDENKDGESDDGDEMDEEAGSVDDLDPTASDEKKLDHGDEDAEKEQEGKNEKGNKSEDAVAADEDATANEEGSSESESVGDELEGEQEQTAGQDEIEKHDPHVKDSEALDLPDEMELDGPDGEDEDVDAMSDDDDSLGPVDDQEEEQVDHAGAEDDTDTEQNKDDKENMESQMVDIDADENESEEKTDQVGEQEDDATNDEPKDDEQDLLQAQDDDAQADASALASDAQGLGQDQEEEDNQAQDSHSKAQREQRGQCQHVPENQDQAAASTGDEGHQAQGEAQESGQEDMQDAAVAQTYKRLGDALERWHRQQKQIQQAERDPDKKDEQQQQPLPDQPERDKDFRHLQDEDAEADTQALGTATKEQAQALDDEMAIDQDEGEDQQPRDEFLPDIQEVEAEEQSMHDRQDPQNVEPNAPDAQAGALIQQAQDHIDTSDNLEPLAEQDGSDELMQVDEKLHDTHLDPDAGTSSAPLSIRWQEVEAATMPLSLSLTEQLRLILTPTHATKMRGAFRTGKRLNIKRIIPYIASSYKRDKIWMRRSVPAKRNYQIMLALDDSKSMRESGSANLAIQTMVMISRALTMLEAGELCVVGFGEDIRLAHRFEDVWGGDAGPRVLSCFGFDQGRTDVKRLVSESMQLFRTARQRASGSAAELWQLELIISDGVCDSRDHDDIRRLLRAALEERIMMVFVIVDDVATKSKSKSQSQTTTTTTTTTTTATAKKAESVLDLKEAKFVPNALGGSDVRIVRYLDTFPFPYYLVVSDVRELPGVLAALLRQWFAEVTESA